MNTENKFRQLTRFPRTKVRVYTGKPWDNHTGERIEIVLDVAEARALYATLDMHSSEYGVEPKIYGLEDLLYEAIKSINGFDK